MIVFDFSRTNVEGFRDFEFENRIPIIAAPAT